MENAQVTDLMAKVVEAVKSLPYGWNHEIKHEPSSASFDEDGHFSLWFNVNEYSKNRNYITVKVDYENGILEEVQIFRHKKCSFGLVTDGSRKMLKDIITKNLLSFLAKKPKVKKVKEPLTTEQRMVNDFFKYNRTHNVVR